MIGSLFRRVRGSIDFPDLAMALFVASAFLFGGASRENALRLALVELASLPLLVGAAGTLIRTGDWGKHRRALLIVGALVAIPLLSLIPLPAGVWQALPGREQLALGLSVSGIAPGWVPASLTPDLTWRGFLALSPPIALFLGVLAYGVPFAQRTLLVCLVAGLAGLGLGVLQMATGTTQLYLWATTDAGNVAGFFANRNHLATLCLIGVPFALILAIENRNYRSQMRTASAWIGFLYVAVAIIAIGAIRSRAGILMILPVIVLSGGLATASVRRITPALLGLILLVAVSVTAIGTLAIRPILARFQSGAPEGRFENWPVVADAAQTYFPVGSGIGSFDAVYRSVEPLARLDSTFFNHAHNEYLEIWLETGIFGIVLLAAFLVWLGRVALQAWGAEKGLFRNLQLSAVVAILTVMLHSAADYPLRTETIAVVFALLCGVLALPARVGEPRQVRTRQRRRRRSAT